MIEFQIKSRVHGNFDTAIEAAEARDAYALSIRGEFAVLNLKEGGGHYVP